MEVTNKMIEYCEAQPWDDDLRQEVYLKVLEAEEADVNTAWLSRIYTNLFLNTLRDITRRHDLRTDHSEEIVDLMGLGDTDNDPMDRLIAHETVQENLDSLSPLLRDAVQAIAIEGRDVAKFAKEEGVGERAIYLRYERALAILKEKNTQSERSTKTQEGMEEERRAEFKSRARAIDMRRERMKLAKEGSFLDKWKLGETQ